MVMGYKEKRRHIGGQDRGEAALYAWFPFVRRLAEDRG